MSGNITFGTAKGPSEHCSDLVEKIKDDIYGYSGLIDIAQLFGVIEIVKHDLILEILDGSDS